MLETLEQIKADGLTALESVDSDDALEAWRVAYLGTKGKLKGAMAGMKDVPVDQKPLVGKTMNEVKSALDAAFKARQAGLGGGGAAVTTGPMLDVTIPGEPSPLGRSHIITRTAQDIIEVFARMGFDVAEGPEVEDEDHNFIKLNIPPEHPARDPLDNFYVDRNTLLRSQTSTVQIRVMEKTQPPIKIVAPGRVYRPDEVDATHSFMFHQIEGLYVDHNVTMADLKTALFQFAKAYFGPESEIRLRPSFFPFTEPSAEMDMKMPIKGEMQWVELGGCGMVDPNVFEFVGYDPEEWTGYAFGLGIERIAMGRYGIPDMRLLFENDVRFLGQF
ncbi:MAG: phenylalanine--tRNA ligase subunit alpha [Phycisphaerales bacterium]|nr:phenylalanine--tRNA ligase subunit alpha [Phycisphaerales bacterium]